MQSFFKRRLLTLFTAFYKFGELSSDELSKRTVVEPESSCKGFHALGCRGIEVQSLLVFLHTVRCHYSAVFRLSHSETGV